MRMIDLHTHSTASDGTDSPAKLVENAARADLAALALTDHDTLSGLDEAEEAARNTGMEFIRGCEISTATGKTRLHVVALWVPEDCPELAAFLTQMREERSKRNARMIEKLRAAGMDITLEEVEAKATVSVGRPHIAEVMIEKGYAKSRDDAFADWLAPGGAAYLPKAAPKPEEAIRLVTRVGASAVLAHPLLKSRISVEHLDELLASFKEAGLFAVEAWHSEQNEEQSKAIVRLAAKYDLGLSGGSDYHGDNKKGIALGTGSGNLHIRPEVLEKLKNRRRAQGLPC